MFVCFIAPRALLLENARVTALGPALSPPRVAGEPCLLHIGESRKAISRRRGYTSGPVLAIAFSSRGPEVPRYTVH